MAIVDSPALRTDIIPFIAETVRGKDVLDAGCADHQAERQSDPAGSTNTLRGPRDPSLASSYSNLKPSNCGSAVITSSWAMQ
jgi:hypothetical protein